MYRQHLGRLCENIAAEYLISLGYQILQLNYHTRFGEIDIIAIKGQMVSFVEVKGRRSESFGTAEQALGRQKLLKIFKSAQVYLENNKIGKNISWRLAAITIKLDQNLKLEKLNYYKDLSL